MARAGGSREVWAGRKTLLWGEAQMLFMWEGRSSAMQQAGWVTSDRVGGDHLDSEGSSQEESKNLNVSWKLPSNISGPTLEISKVRPKVQRDFSKVAQLAP